MHMIMPSWIVSKSRSTPITALPPAHGSRLLSHLPEGDLLRVVQLAFVSAASAADDIGDSRQKIADHIGPHDRLTAGNPEIFHDFFSLEGVGGGDEHGNPPSLIKHP